RRQIAGQRVETPLHGRLREKLDEPPRGGLVARRPKHHQTRASGDRGAGTIGPRQGRGPPAVPLVGRKPARGFGDGPRAGDVEDEATTSELAPDVRDCRSSDHRRPSLPEDLEIEPERTAEPGAAEVAPPSVVAQKGLILLQRESEERLELVEREKNPGGIPSCLCADPGHPPPPFVPPAGRCRASGARQPVPRG